FFQAEDGIRDDLVTGVQTCALPIWTTVLLVCLGLVAVTWAVFGQTLAHNFVNFDDHVYVYDNPLIVKGISTEGIIGAFAHTHALDRKSTRLNSSHQIISYAVFCLKK